MLNTIGQQLKERYIQNQSVCEKVVNIFSLMSNKIRFRVLCVLAMEDFCVNEIIEIIGCGKQSNVSQQLKLLVMSGLVTRKKDGTQMIYQLKDDNIRELIRFLENKYLEEEAQ